MDHFLYDKIKDLDCPYDVREEIARWKPVTGLWDLTWFFEPPAGFEENKNVSSNNTFSKHGRLKRRSVLEEDPMRRPPHDEWGPMMERMESWSVAASDTQLFKSTVFRH
jgi:hypothetical protein